MIFPHFHFVSSQIIVEITGGTNVLNARLSESTDLSNSDIYYKVLKNEFQIMLEIEHGKEDIQYFTRAQQFEHAYWGNENGYDIYVHILLCPLYKLASTWGLALNPSTNLFIAFIYGRISR